MFRNLSIGVAGFFGLLLAGLVAAWFIADDMWTQSATSRDVPDGWVAPSRSGVATRYEHGRWAEEYRFDDQDRRVEWTYDDADGQRHVHKFDPETGNELSHDVIPNPPPMPASVRE